MSSARRLALRTLLVLCALAAGVLPAAAQTIGGYVLVRQQRIGPITLLVYRATLSNAGGPALQSATARATSSARATIVLDGQLSYGPVAAGGSAASQDTITLMHIGATPFSLSALSWTVTAQPAPVSLSLRIGPISSVQAGTSFSVAVEAMNGASLNPTFTGIVTLSAAATGGSNFNGGSRTATAVAGVATFSGLVLNNAADGYISSASAPGATAANSNGFNVTADHLWVAQSIGDVAAGTAFNVATEARDANNALAENFTGTVTLSAAAVGGSNFNGGSPASAAAGGGVNFSGLALNNAADGYIATATSAGLSNGTSNAFDVGPHHLMFTAAPPASVRAGTAFGVAVEARDADDNVAEGFSSTVTLNAAAFGGSNFTGGSQTATAANGVATFSGLVLNNAADGYISSASAPGATAANSNGFNVTADHLWVAQSIGDVAAGTAFNVATEARDANNALAENFTGTVTLSAAAVGGSNFNGGSPASAAAGGGVNFSGLALNNAADGYIATASSPGLSNGSSNPFDVGPLRLTFSAQPPIRVRAGDSFDVTVEARDADNNVAENFNSTLTLSAAAMGGSNFTGGSPTANALLGAATFSGLVLNNAANAYLITANAGGAGTADSAVFDVTARTLFVLPVANQTAGAPFDLIVQARDADGSVAENFTGTIGLSASAEDGADFTTSPAGPASAGVASFSGLILQTAATGYAITAVAPGVADGSSNLFDVDAPGATAVLSVDGVGYAPSKVFLGGGFGYLPANADYTLTNTGSAPMSWTAEVSNPWLTVSPASGTLDPGANVVVQLSIDAAMADTLLAAEYTGRVYFSNRSGGTGSTTRPVYLALNGIWPLRVRPAYSFLATGSLTSPPAPATFTYTLTNLNTVIPVDWSGTSSKSWVQLSSSGGTIPGFQSVQVTATLTPGPTDFQIGTSAATLTFTQFNCCPDLLNFRFVKVIITEDDPPALTIDAPVPGVMSTTLSGTVADNGTIAALVWSNARTGQTGTIDIDQGAWTVSIPLMAGTNDVTVTAFDDLGNFSSRTLSVDGALSPAAAMLSTSLAAATRLHPSLRRRGPAGGAGMSARLRSERPE